MFYSERLALVLRSEDELRSCLERSQSAIVVARRRDLEKLAEPLPLGEITRDGVGRDRGSLLVSLSDSAPGDAQAD
ncbi:MAG: hypothetical protein V3T81_01090 [Thermoanaerobaculia bacterium]